MKLLFTTQPALGHFHPLVPLARAAIAAGHCVRFACAASFVPVVTAAGFEAIAAGLDWLESEAERSFPELALMPPGPATNEWWARHIFAGVTADRMADDLLALTCSDRPDVIVRDPLELGGCILAERLDIPHASAGASIFVPPRAWQQLMQVPLSKLCARYGLPTEATMQMPYRWLDLSAVPRSLLDSDYLTPVTHFVQPDPFDRKQDSAAPDWLEQPRRLPLVSASLGTVFYRTPGVFEDICEALRGEPLEAALTVGPGYDRARLPALPPHIHVDDYIAQTVLLPRCQLLINHGGLNSIVSALWHGLPMLLLPIGADQPANAHRCRAAGVAVVVEPGQRSAQTIRAAVREALGDPRYRRNAQRIRDEIGELPPMAAGIERLGQLHRTRAPQRRNLPWWGRLHSLASHVL